MESESEMKKSLDAKKIRKVMESAQIKEAFVADDSVIDAFKTFNKSLGDVRSVAFDLQNKLMAMQGYVENAMKSDKPVDNRGILKEIEPLVRKLDKSIGSQNQTGSLWNLWYDFFRKLR